MEAGHRLDQYRIYKIKKKNYEKLIRVFVTCMKVKKKKNDIYKINKETYNSIYCEFFLYKIQA